MNRPNTPPNRFGSALNDVFGHPLFTTEPTAKGWNPAADVIADTEGYRFKFDVPGVPRDAIHVNVEDRILTVTGERTDASEQGPSNDENEAKDTGKVWRRERFYGKFVRAFQLPTDADSASIRAHYQDGVLEVSVPKTESVKARRVEISG